MGNENAAPVPLWSMRAWAQLIAGLFGFGVCVALMVRSGLGLGPWDALHVGLSRQTGMSIGVASIAVGVLIVAGSWFIGIRPGPGTIANMVLIGVFIDLVIGWIPRAANLWIGFGMYVAAILLCGLATGVYIAAGLGEGPRDGLILGLTTRSGWTIRRVRTLVELSALGFGWAMGGAVGIGTLMFAFGIGPAMQWGMQVCGVGGPEARREHTAEV